MDNSIFLPTNENEVSAYLKQIRKYKVMTPKREREISKIMTSNNLTENVKEKIKNEVIHGNLRFVITICKEYQNQGVDFIDLISEGNYGLLKAFDNFEWERNIRFISYSKWWIKQAVLETLNKNSRTIRLPVNIIHEYYKVKKKINDMGFGEPILQLPKSICLDSAVNDDGHSLSDVIHDDNANEFSELDSKKVLIKKTMSILNKLDERERYIIKKYFGIGCEQENLEDIGDYLNLTKERVRQIKEKSIRKLRNETIELFELI